MMQGRTFKILLGTAAALALLRTTKREMGEADAEVSEETESEEVLAATGLLANAYEQELLERLPVDLTPYEDAEPTCGQHYQARRGDTWLGAHERSITFRALFRSTFAHATLRGLSDAKARALRNANNAGMRKALFDLAVSGMWSDEVYGTYLLSSKDPVGPHGRGIPLVRCHGANRDRLLAGEAVLRIVPRGEPSDRGIGVPGRKVLHDTVLGVVPMALPYLWLPCVNPEELLNARVTTRGMKWADGSSTIEPPPAVVRLQIARLG